MRFKQRKKLDSDAGLLSSRHMLQKHEMIHDVDLDRQAIKVHQTAGYIPKHGYVENEPKTAAGRRTVLPPSLVVDMLKQHRVQQLEVRLKAGSVWEDCDLVFTDLSGGYFNPRNLEKLFRQVLIEAGLPLMHFHNLRHSAATLLLSMGVPLKVIQEILGARRIIHHVQKQYHGNSQVVKIRDFAATRL